MSIVAGDWREWWTNEDRQSDRCRKNSLRPDLQNILRQSYEYLSYDGLTTDVKFTKHVREDTRLSLGTIHLQYGKIVLDSVRELALRYS